MTLSIELIPNVKCQLGLSVCYQNSDTVKVHRVNSLHKPFLGHYVPVLGKWQLSQSQANV